MEKGKSQDVVLTAGPPHRAVLFELKGERSTEDGTSASSSTEMFAALSMEEVIAYVRRRQPSTEINELKVLGTVQVLSSSEHVV